MLAYQEYFSKSPAEVLSIIDSSEEGLGSGAAKSRLARFGPNEIEHARPAWHVILYRQLNSFFVYLLGAAVILNSFLKEYLDAFIILLFTSAFVVTGFYQEFKAEKAIYDLREFLLRYAKVKRDGRVVSIPIQQIAPGDIVLLEEGDLIPADVRFISVKNILVDESVLTGESSPVAKTSAAVDSDVRSDTEAKNLGFFGSSVVDGSGVAAVIATGPRTYFASTFEHLNRIERPSIFEKNIKTIGKFLSNMILLLGVLVLAGKVFVSHRLDINFIVFMVALVVAAVPEALPLVVTLSFSRGALRLAKKKVVVKRLTAIEDLGNVEILCTDKTGTITKNELEIAREYGGDPKNRLRLFALGSLAGKTAITLYNPFDKAIFKAAPAKVIKELGKIALVEALPFDPIRRIGSIVYRENGKRYLLSRGAPEDVLSHCDFYVSGSGRSSPVTLPYRKEALSWFKERGAEGERVLAVSVKQVKGSAIDVAKEEKTGMAFAGMISFTDPLKETSKDALSLVKRLGISLKIITGDSVEVAGAVGRELGLIADPKNVLDGDSFDRMTDLEKNDAVFSHRVFARMLPLHKYEIIERLKTRNAVAFLGEGFNDVPALKIADIALVVEEGADAAKNSADVVLTEPDLMVIGQGIEEGRRIFANVVKYIRTTLSESFGNFFSITLASLLLPFLPMLSVQLLLVNLLTDMPMVMIYRDNVSQSEVEKPEKYHLKYLYAFVILFGIVSSIYDFVYFGTFLKFGEHILQTGWFTESILTGAAGFFSIRTFLPFYRGAHPAKPLIAAAITAGFLAIFLPYWPSARKFFHFVPLSFSQIAVIMAIVAFYFLTNEAVKYFYRLAFVKRG